MIITFLDNNFEEIESHSIDIDLKDAMRMISSFKEFKVGTDKLRYEKTGWTSLNLDENEIEIQLNFE